MTEQIQHAPKPDASKGAEILKKILGDSGADDQVPPAGDAPIVDSTQPPKELELDTGNGVKRRVSVEELGKLFNRKEKLDAAEQALNERLAKLGELNNLRERLGGLSPARRQKLLELLHADEDPEGGDGAEDDSEALEAAFGEGGRSNGSRSADPAVDRLLQRLEKHDQVLQALAARENERLRAERTQSTGERLNALLSEYPVFKGDQNAAAREFAKDSIMSQFASARSNDPAVLEQLVQNAASKLQDMITKTRQEEREGVGVPRQMEVTGVPKGGFKGRDLKNGKVRDLAQQLLGRPAG